MRTIQIMINEKRKIVKVIQIWRD